ncbi:RHOMBOID-like protein 5 [Mercurialis annua]|uniref:RHOMBOID-like protein 5 n=1 Tax=Mercurialis annua TaxID=3986 RepID=UPI00215E24DD|nr:RHOMBOID-like protein 5 [Mercurialis annua]
MGKGPPRPDIEVGAYAKRPPPPPPPPLLEKWRPWLVPLIFAVNITTFVYTMYVNDCPANTGADKCLLYDLLERFSFQPLQENPVLGPSVVTLQHLGALDPVLIVKNGEAWRFFSCIWLHAGVVHLITNMASLLFIGIRLEEEFGFLRIGLLYVISGFGGSLMSSLHRKPSISVGASGALLGLLGSMLSELLVNWTIYTNKCSAISTLLLVIGLNLALGFIPHVDNSAHIGGFISGLLLGFILLMRPQYGYVNHRYIPAGYDIKTKSKHKCYQYLLLITAFIILIAGYIWGLATLYNGHRVQIPQNFNL